MPKPQGRPPKLTPHQKAEIGRRLATGEPGRVLAREFNVAETTIRRNFSAQTAKIQLLANTLASAELEMVKLPLSSQISVRALADDLKTISNNLARAARVGSETGAKLAEMARKKVGRVIMEDGGLDVITLKEVASLTAVSNQALDPAVRLVAASLGKNEPSQDAEPLEIIIQPVKPRE